MNVLSRVPVRGGLLVGVLWLSGCLGSQSPDAVHPEQETTPTTIADVQFDAALYQISGPYSHKNLTAFLVLSENQDDRNFLTLDEGLKEGLVKITEQEQESVGTLSLENNSDLPLYLQEGERLQGGKQDRTIIASLVVPARSGKTAVRTMCIEQSRWVAGARGESFAACSSQALAPKGVRCAAKVENRQDKVWSNVSVQKSNNAQTYLTPNTNSSVNEMLDSPQMQRIADDFSKALHKAPGDQPQAVGLAIAVNGVIEEVNIYPNHALLTRYYPRLIKSYGIQAAMLKDQAKEAKVLTADDVAQFLKDKKVKSEHKDELDSHNTQSVQELDNDQYLCVTQHQGKQVHWQMLKKNRTSGGAARDLLGTDW